MAKKAKARQRAVEVVDGNLLYARAKAKQVRAHKALEREIMRSATQLEKLILKRNASLRRLHTFLGAELAINDRVSTPDAAVNE